jgi:hypothetical protein
MISYTGERTLYGKLSSDSSTANLDLGTILMNECRRQILNARRWKFLEKSKTLSTVASQQAYDLPSDLEWLTGLTVTISTQKYRPIQVNSREEWDRLNQSTTPTSDIPEYFFVNNTTLEFYPTPSSSTSNAITFKYGRKQKDLSIADYTAGTITSIANGASAVVGSSTSWTVKMANRWIRITDSDTANTGDGEWYEITSVSSTTALTLDFLYSGLSISAGTAAYTIAQVSLLPEAYHMIPVYKALVHYFTSIKPDQVKSKLYNDMYVNLFAEMEASEADNSSSNVLNPGIYQQMPRNPNNYINTGAIS